MGGVGGGAEHIRIHKQIQQKVTAVARFKDQSWTDRLNVAFKYFPQNRVRDQKPARVGWSQPCAKSKPLRMCFDLHRAIRTTLDPVAITVGEESTDFQLMLKRLASL